MCLNCQCVAGAPPTSTLPTSSLWKSALSQTCKDVVACIPALLELVGNAGLPGVAAQLPQLWLAIAAMALPDADPAVALGVEGDDAGDAGAVTSPAAAVTSPHAT
jgi:hypothetical protein